MKTTFTCPVLILTSQTWVCDTETVLCGRTLHVVTWFKSNYFESMDSKTSWKVPDTTSHTKGRRNKVLLPTWWISHESLPDVLSCLLIWRTAAEFCLLPVSGRICVCVSSGSGAISLSYISIGGLVLRTQQLSHCSGGNRLTVADVAALARRCE